MAFTQGDIAVTQLDETQWGLMEELIYQGSNQTCVVPVGFVTDFASVPRAFVWLLPTYGVYTKAAILHDYLCVYAPVNRADADGIFRRAMRELGVPFIRRWMMWAAVRAGSRLKGAKGGEIALWLLVTIPTVIFMMIPTVVIVIWLTMFWLIEWVCYLGLKPLSKKPVNRPQFMPNTPPPGA